MSIWTPLHTRPATWPTTTPAMSPTITRVHHFFTINEFRTFVESGPSRIHAATSGRGPDRLNGAKIRAKGRPGTKVGLAENTAVAALLIESGEMYYVVDGGVPRAQFHGTELNSSEQPGQQLFADREVLALPAPL